MFLADKGDTARHNRDYVILLTMRLLCFAVVVALLTVHVRSLRVFRWEQTVSGGLIVTYVIAVLGLALCAGSEDCGSRALQLALRRSINGMKWLTIAAVVAVLRIHYRCLMVLHRTQPATGIVLVANISAFSGLTYLVAMEQCEYILFSMYLCAVGATLLGLNAFVIWRRWQLAGDLTRVVAELLGAVGVPLRRQILVKAILSAAAAVLMLFDLMWILMNKAPVKKS